MYAALIWMSIQNVAKYACKPLVVYQLKCIEDIQIFGMDMTFISSSEAKNLYFMSGRATNEIYNFSLY